MTDSLSAEQQGLLQDIISHPLKISPRLVYADWLEEYGDRESRHHAELIRYDKPVMLRSYVETEESDWTFPRDHPVYPPSDEYRKLCIARTHLRSVRESLSPQVVKGVTYRHGFIEVIKAPFEVLVKGLPRWVTEYPLTGVEVSDLKPWKDPSGDIWTWWERAIDMTQIGILKGVNGGKVFQQMWDDALGRDNGDDVGRWLDFDTPEEAVKALSDTLLDMARKGVL